MKHGKKFLSLMLAALIVICSMPVTMQKVNATDICYNTEVTVDVKDYRSGWIMKAYNGYVYYELFGPNNLYEWQADIVISCVSEDGTRVSQVIDILNGTDADEYSLIFETDFNPVSVTADFYYLDEFTVEGNFSNLGVQGGIKTMGIEASVTSISNNSVINSANKDFETSEAINLLDLGTVKYDVADYGYFTGTVGLHTGTYQLILRDIEENGNDDENLTEQYPDGYDPDLDKYGFGNLNKTIDVDYYKTIYGDVKGENLHKKYDKESHGVCFGMANTTASFIKNKNLLKTFSSLSFDLETDEEITIIPNDLNSIDAADASSYTSSEGISVLDYIKYVHITQYSSEVINTHKSTKNDLKGLYSAVQDFVDGNGQTVGIYLYNTKLFGTKWNMHEILAVGVSEETDGYHIKINDSNNFHELTDFIISKDFTAWKYEIPGKSNNDGSEYCYSSENGGFSYGCWADLAYDTGWNAGHIDSNRRLMVITEEVIIENNVIEIPENIGNDATSETSETKLYWLDEATTSVEITATSDNTEITISDVNSSVTATINAGANAQFNVDDNGTNSVAFESKANDNAVITFVTADESGYLITTTITGMASGDEVTATETDNGMQVTGLNNITVTYETVDGTDTATADINDGSKADIIINGTNVEIITDEKSTDTESDWNCSHLCHSENGFMQFIWKIVKFIYRIFGTNQYCDCGMAHW